MFDVGRSSSSRSPRTSRFDEYEDSDGSSDTARSRKVPGSTASAAYYISHPRTRAPFSSSSSSSNHLARPARPPDLLYSHYGAHAASSRTSLSSNTSMATPIPSRSTSPVPLLYSSAPSSSSPSDTDDESDSLVLAGPHGAWEREQRPRWWTLGHRTRRRRRDGAFDVRTTLRRAVRRVVRHPLFPKHPITILLTLSFLTLLALSVTALLIYILNPDKEPLPWRAYCTVPVLSSDPPKPGVPVTAPDIFTVGHSAPYPPFPPENFDSLPPAGVFIGVFSVDSSFDRRMMIRETWANHPHSRNGAGVGDEGNGTSRTVVRFIVGQPRKAWERRIKLEMEKFHDIVILPVAENMNDGKSYVFMSWAAAMAWVPPLYFNTTIPRPELSYAKYSNPAPSLAQHDPSYAWQDRAHAQPKDWVRPDFVVKADDDSFIMIAELEARLRVALHAHTATNSSTSSVDHDHVLGRRAPPPPQPPPVSTLPAPSPVSTSSSPEATEITRAPPPTTPSPLKDPLIYWGYLVKQRFMAGEMYALSWSLVDWVSKDQVVKGHTRGAEDKQTAKWMRMHPRAPAVRWVNERCWIYDHPRGGTVYSHGFLFPSEASRVRKAMNEKGALELQGADAPVAVAVAPSGSGSSLPAIPSAWSHSTVSTWHTRYSAPVPDLTSLQSVEALVEGSVMSQLHEGSILTAADAWKQREGRKTRYEGKRLGGTVVVHFIKKNMWYLETALAFLEGDEETPLEALRRERGSS